MSDPDLNPSIAEDTGRLGVVDALVFRRLSSSTWAHLGGIGRGRGWAGVVDVDAGQDPLMDSVPTEIGGVHVFTHPDGGRVLGPYYAVGGALVRVSNDVVVILGNPSAPLHGEVSPDDLRRLADAIDDSVEDVTPSKRLADELEVLHAVRAVTTGSTVSLEDTLRHVVDVAVNALSCEVGILRHGSGHIVATTSWSELDVHDPGVVAAVDSLQERAAGGSLCIQDTEAEPVLAPLGRDHGVRSLLVITLPAPAVGVLVVAHTSAGPRGFTDLCQQLARQVCDAASVVVHTAGLRDQLREVAEEQSRTARRDPLTGLGNRLVWDEVLVRAQEQVDAGQPVTVITVDVDGLKRTNDAHGHAAGDALLRYCADILRQHGREGDVIARLGGDEFAMLLPVAGPVVDERLTSLRSRLDNATSCEPAIAASVGAATAPAGGSVADAAREADAAMYAAKRTRRVPLGDGLRRGPTGWVAEAAS